jgi:HD superfamily phosphohydrolase
VQEPFLKEKVHENCNITINGEFYSDRPIRLFNVEDMSGDISEIEMLGDTFKQNFTNTKIPGKDGYNTFSVGFKKKSINSIANVMEARNYLYLWIYAHHKVIYYANFLIPVIAKEIMSNSDNKRIWNLDFDNIKYLDDAYLWTIIKYNYYNQNETNKKSKNELALLLRELFTRKYKKSLYKSLAEYDLFFEKYDEKTKSMLPDDINRVLDGNKKNSRP